MMKKTFIFLLVLLLTGSGAAFAQAELTLDPGTVLGPIKMMNAGNNGPISGNKEAYKALRIPYARTHDTALGTEYGGHCIDIDQVFPNFNADVNCPKSYDFTNSDKVLTEMLEVGTKVFYRLGQSIEHQKKKYGIFPPKDYKKWAKICEHIIRHYNEGWADGYRMDIEYWEIWNEPDLDAYDDRWKTDPRTWGGTQEQFNELYVLTAKHLKKCFPHLKIGGPAFANPRRFGPAFLDYVKEKGAPLDFFSHHMYHRKPSRISEDVCKVREMLDEKGFKETESILNEWNYNRSWEEKDYYSKRVRPTNKAAAFVAAVMCECQNNPLDMLMYYDLRPNTSWCGPFQAFVFDIQPPYWALFYWAELVDYGTQVGSRCDTGNIYSCAALSQDDGTVRQLVARYHDDDAHNSSREVSLNAPEGWQVTGIRLTDSQGMDRALDPTDKLTLESNAIALIEWNYTK